MREDSLSAEKGITEERFDNLEKKVDMVLKILQGNDTPEKGFIIRLDRVERTLEFVGKLLTPLYAALLVQMIALVALLISGKLALVIHP